MIQPLQLNSNINFKSNPPLSAANAAIVNDAQQKQAQPQKEKKSITDMYMSAKKSVTNVIKGVNSTVGITAGATQGLAEGALAAGVIGLLGKNFKNGEGKIIETTAGIAKDIWSAIKVVPNAIKNIWSNSPKDNLTKLFTEAIPNGARTLWGGLNKHKATALIATGVGVAIFALRTIQGKVKANVKNADLDHATNQGHS